MLQFVVLGMLAITMTVAAFGGELTPPGPPAPTMHTLNEIFDEANEANKAVGGGEAMLVYPEVRESSLDVAADNPRTYDAIVNLTDTTRLQYLNELFVVTPEPTSLEAAVVEIYLLRPNGEPATSFLGEEIANPRIVDLGEGDISKRINLSDLFDEGDGWPGGEGPYTLVLRLASGDWSDVAVDVRQLYLDNEKNLLTFTLTPTRVPAKPIEVGPVKDGGAAKP